MASIGLRRVRDDQRRRLGGAQRGGVRRASAALSSASRAFARVEYRLRLGQGVRRRRNGDQAHGRREHSRPPPSKTLTSRASRPTAMTILGGGRRCGWAAAKAGACSSTRRSSRSARRPSRKRSASRKVEAIPGDPPRQKGDRAQGRRKDDADAQQGQLHDYRSQDQLRSHERGCHRQRRLDPAELRRTTMTVTYDEHSPVTARARSDDLRRRSEFHATPSTSASTKVAVAARRRRGPTGTRCTCRPSARFCRSAPRRGSGSPMSALPVTPITTSISRPRPPPRRS